MTTFDIESFEAMAGAETKTLHVAMIGTRGVPAAYGGFETAVEEVGRRLVERGHRDSDDRARGPGHHARRGHDHDHGRPG